MMISLNKVLRYAMIAQFVAMSALANGWPGVDVKPLRKERSDLGPGQSGTYYQLSDSERKELVWMAKAAKTSRKKKSAEDIDRKGSLEYEAANGKPPLEKKSGEMEKKI